jgi:phosphatidylglycerophosphate synthase
LSGVGGVFSRPLIEQLRQDVLEGQAIVVAHRSKRHHLPRTEEGPGGLSFGSAGAEFADLVVLPSVLLSEAGRLAAEPGVVPVRRWLEHAAKDGRVRVVSTDASPTHWYQDIRNVGDLPAAERKLFSSLKSEFEGFIDRFFNRKLSRWFTRLFLALGLSPNSITMVATIVGLIAAVEFGRGTYAAGLVAALLFQLAAVIDCCDGEVARLTFTESPFGAWLDIAMDNVVHMAIFGGIAMGAYVRAAGTKQEWVPLALGAVAILGNALSFVLVNKAQKVKQASEWKTPVHAAWSDFMLKNVASRDFSAVILAFALFGKLDLFLWIAAAGSLVFALAMVWVLRPSAISRA